MLGAFERHIQCARCVIARHRDWTRRLSAIKGNRGRINDSRFERVALLRYFPRHHEARERNRQRARARGLSEGG